VVDMDSPSSSHCNARCRQQSRQSFRHTLADAVFLTPLTLLAVPTFEFELALFMDAKLDVSKL